MERSGIAGDPRFFARSGPFTPAVVAAAAGGTVSQSAAAVPLAGVAPLAVAGPDQVGFLDNRKYLPDLKTTRAGAVLVHPDLAAAVPAGTVAILTPDPHAGWARVAALFHPLPPVEPGIHPSAVIDPAARVDPSAEIGPLTVIGPGAEIGARCRIGPLAAIGASVTIGADCRIGAHTTLSHALLGARVTVFPGVRIGQEGFGFAITDRGFLSVPQLGRVVIEDDVEIGANCTIDRGSLRDTVIGTGTRLDNLVQIGHNVQIGRWCVIVAQVGISGSTTLEDHVMIGGQAGLNGHVRVGRGTRIGAQAGVISDLPAGVEVLGSPAQPRRLFLRQVAWLRRMTARDRDGATP